MKKNNYKYQVGDIVNDSLKIVDYYEIKMGVY